MQGVGSLCHCRQVKQSDVGTSAHKECAALSQLSHLCEKLESSFPLCCTVREWKKIAKQPDVLDRLASRARWIMQEELGFSLSLQASNVDRRGLGVFVKNSIAKEKVVGLYPGEFTVYLLKIRHFQNNFISGLPNKIN